MAYGRFTHPEVMTRKGQSSRWEYRAWVKLLARKRRRSDDRQLGYRARMQVEREQG